LTFLPIPAILAIMQTIGSTILKNSLNRYLAQVTRGARFIITDHGRPVAKLVPLSDEGNKTPSDIVAELLSKGTITCGNSLQHSELQNMPSFKLKLKGVSAAEILLQDRER
jgi:prevent-host-death family protein